jgi:arsenical pump membrane protein
MSLSELAREAGLFDWAAGRVAFLARGSALRLFIMVYGMAVLVTIFLSNDATVVVLTPAVAAMARAAGVAAPLPYLLICAFVANAASFVLPISNPANLVFYGAVLPRLVDWLGLFGVASGLAIVATFAALWATQRAALRAPVSTPAAPAKLGAAGTRAAIGVAGAALVMVLASASGVPLGLPAFLVACASAVLVLAPSRRSPAAMLRGISWEILPLVAGLFVMVSALDAGGAARALGHLLSAAPPWAAGLELGLATNLVNNLPAGLLAGHALAGATPQLRAAAIIGTDLGPNLSVTGSLATLLWLAVLRREGIAMSAGAFLRLGLVVMPPALGLALWAVK